MRQLLIALLWCFSIQAQTFDFSCEPQLADDDPMKYYNEFIADAATYGWDFGDQSTYIVEPQQVYVLTQLDPPVGHFESHGGSESPSSIVFSDDISARADAAGRCTQGYKIRINPNFWYAPYYTGEELNRFRKFIMYHELGHDLLDLSHICRRIEGGDPTEFRPHDDIMWAAGICSPYPDEVVRSFTASKLWLNPAKFQQRIEEMFNLEHQTRNCSNLQ